MDVVWGVAGRAFRLRSSCAEVEALARVVFAPWSVEERRLLATWTIEPREGQWEVRCDRNEEVRLSASRQDALVWVEYGSIVLLDLDGHLALHGALLQPPGGGPALVLAGAGEAGKSTLAAALWGSGWRLLSDDTAFVNYAGTQAWPAPRRCALRKESQALLSPELWARIEAAPGAAALARGPVYHADEARSTHLEAVPLGAVAIIKVEPGSVARMVPSAAVFALAVFCRSYSKMGMGALLEPLCALANRVPVLELPRSSLPEMMLALQEQVLPLFSGIAPQASRLR